MQQQTCLNACDPCCGAKGTRLMSPCASSAKRTFIGTSVHWAVRTRSGRSAICFTPNCAASSEPERMMNTGTDGMNLFNSSTEARDADPYCAQMANRLRASIERHSAKFGPLLGGASQCSSVPMKPGQILLFDEASLDARFESAKSGAERILQSELKQARALGPIRDLATCPTMAAFDALEVDFPHCAAVINLLRQRSALASITAGRAFALPPILLAGPAGVGKTAFSEAVARLLNVPTRRIDMAAATASFVLAGSHSSWSSARPGAIWSLLQSRSASGLVLLDELDKASSGNYPVVGPLYGLLESVSAKAFADEYVELEVDASHICWVATCNNPENIEAALRSRFVQFDVPAPTPNQMPAIARSVYRTKRAQATWGPAFPEELEPTAAAQFALCTPRELSRLIEAAAAHAASSCRSQIRDVDVVAAQREAAGQSRPKRSVGFI
ncbi:MAG: hypothetical protein CFE46_13305 [Burkholderiales bacterium PBB6]|nr:MAG: hypothetical protein CFE46_13305 [Burkholderiales bacterium PBB6]